jgi:hypothetical protein
MPANPKYLEKSNGQRFVKITAGILGGYAISLLVHACSLRWFDKEAVLETATFTLFIVWTTLLLLPFFFKNGWTCWLLYLGVSLLLLSILYM